MPSINAICKRIVGRDSISYATVPTNNPRANYKPVTKPPSILRQSRNNTKKEPSTSNNSEGSATATSASNIHPSCYTANPKSNSHRNAESNTCAAQHHKFYHRSFRVERNRQCSGPLLTKPPGIEAPDLITFGMLFNTDKLLEVDLNSGYSACNARYNTDDCCSCQKKPSDQSLVNLMYCFEKGC